MTRIQALLGDEPRSAGEGLTLRAQGRGGGGRGDKMGRGPGPRAKKGGA